VAPSIPECQRLLRENLAGEFPTGDHIATILTVPNKILGSISTGVALAAVSTTGSDTTINMRLPGLKKKLEELAADGIGQGLEYKGVKFMFVERKYPLPLNHFDIAG
jgi:hypothetical protein